MKIQDIHRPKGANRPHKRVGRGQGSGLGKTSTRGHKGLKARSGGSLRPGFEGGQMPLIRRLPKRGFTSVGKKIYQIVNAETLNRLRKDSVVDKKTLLEEGIIKDSRTPVKILGNGKLLKPLHISADSFSASAKKKIEAAGGSVKYV